MVKSGPSFVQRPPTPVVTSGLAAADVAAVFEAGGITATVTGEQIVPLFGAVGGEVVDIGGTPIQVYSFTDEIEAAKAAAIARNPADLMIEWVSEPQTLRLGNLVMTIVTDDPEQAELLIKALREAGAE